MQFNNVENNKEEKIDIEIEINDQTEAKFSEEQFNLEDEEKSSRFKEGESLTMIRVRFPGNARSFPFLIGKRRFSYGQKVVAMSDRGMTVGYINSFPYEVEFNKSMLPIRSIAKIASEEDIKAQKDFRDSEKKAEVVCLRLIEKHNLDMVLTHVEFIQFGKKAVFYFNAPDRVDFRELVKDLVADLKMRIELRQISVRDRAAALGAVGACGLQTCCSSFLKNYGNVSIKMAKNQNLALIPSKLNGVCGQIKCCIKYEDDVYADKRKVLPKETTIIKTKNGDIGKILKLHLLVEQFEMLTDFGAKRRYASVEYVGDDNLPENYKFPETFDHIVDETKEVIGLIKEVQKKSDQFMNDIEDDEELYFDDENSDEDFDDEDNSIENELEDIEKTMKLAKSNQDESTSSSDNTRDNQRPKPHHHQNRDNRNNNQNRNSHPQNRNNQNRNNDRNAKPRPNNNTGNNQPRSNQENRPANPNQNQPRTDRPNNQPRDQRNNNNRPNNQQGGQTNQNRDNRNNQNRNNDRNFKPRHNNNNQPRPNGGNQNQNQNQNNNREQKEIKKPE